MGFSGLKIEERPVEGTKPRQVCVWVRNGQRLAVMYINVEEKGLVLIHENGVEIKVQRRQGFEFPEEDHRYDDFSSEDHSDDN